MKSLFSILYFITLVGLWLGSSDVSSSRAQVGAFHSDTGKYPGQSLTGQNAVICVFKHLSPPSGFTPTQPYGKPLERGATTISQYPEKGHTIAANLNFATLHHPPKYISPQLSVTTHENSPPTLCITQCHLFLTAEQIHHAHLRQKIGTNCRKPPTPLHALHGSLNLKSSTPSSLHTPHPLGPYHTKLFPTPQHTTHRTTRNTPEKPTLNTTHFQTGGHINISHPKHANLGSGLANQGALAPSTTHNSPPPPTPLGIGRPTNKSCPSLPVVCSHNTIANHTTVWDCRANQLSFGHNLWPFLPAILTDDDQLQRQQLFKEENSKWRILEAPRKQDSRAPRYLSLFLFLPRLYPALISHVPSPPPNVPLYVRPRFRTHSQEPTDPFIHPNAQATSGYYTKYSPTIQQIVPLYAVNIVNLTHYSLYRLHSNASCPRVRTPAGLQGWSDRTALQQRKQRAHPAAPNRYLTHFTSPPRTFATLQSPNITSHATLPAYAPPRNASDGPSPQPPCGWKRCLARRARKSRQQCGATSGYSLNSYTPPPWQTFQSPPFNIACLHTPHPTPPFCLPRNTSRAPSPDPSQGRRTECSTRHCGQHNHLGDDPQPGRTHPRRTTSCCDQIGRAHV